MLEVFGGSGGDTGVSLTGGTYQHRPRVEQGTAPGGGRGVGEPKFRGLGIFTPHL